MAPRCRNGTRRCKATGACVEPRPPNPPGYTGTGANRRLKQRFTCKHGKRQCQNRVCYATTAHAAGTEANAHTTLTNFLKNRRRPLLNAVIVCLAMSHERISDRVRLVNLLQTFRYVVGVSNIAVPANNAEYQELAPYVPSGRYTQFQMDFLAFRQVTAHSRNPLFDYLHAKQHVPERIVCLDYFFLQVPYYRLRLGMNWLLRDDRNGSGALIKREGKARQLLDFATDVYLGVDHQPPNPSLMREMLREYTAFRGTKTMRCTPVRTTPLYELDQEIDIPGPSGGADNQVARYLDENMPFLHIELR